MFTFTAPVRVRNNGKAQARIGFVTRETSIFPDKKSGSYLLPIKADIRKQLEIKEGDQLGIEVTILP